VPDSSRWKRPDGFSDPSCWALPRPVGACAEYHTPALAQNALNSVRDATNNWISITLTTAMGDVVPIIVFLNIKASVAGGDRIVNRR
jgi:hypothetical protein